MEWYPGLSKCLGLEYKVRDVGAKPSSQTKPFGSTTPLANPSQDHPHGGTLQLPEEKLEEVSPFQQKHLPLGERNLDYLGSLGHIWWDKVAPLPQGRAGGCSVWNRTAKNPMG